MIHINNFSVSWHVGVDSILWNCVGSRSYDLDQLKSGVVGEWVGAWASSSPGPYRYWDVPHTTTELRSGPISLCVKHPNICTGPASSGRGVWAWVVWHDYLRFTDPTIVFPDPSVDTRVPRTALGGQTGISPHHSTHRGTLNSKNIQIIYTIRISYVGCWLRTTHRETLQIQIISLLEQL